MSALEQVGILLAVAMVWLLLNIKAGTGCLKFVSLIGLLVFMAMASWVAIQAVLA